jgi:hypothetical protein
MVLKIRLNWLKKTGMSSLAEIERAAEALPLEQQESLFKWPSGRLRNRSLESISRHSLLDIAPVSLGGVIRPLGPNDDLLGEMLEDRPLGFNF